MATIVDRLIGTLKLGDVTTGVNMEAQVTAIGTPQTVTRDAAVTVLTGDLIQAQATYSYALSGTVLLDWSNKTGIFYFVHSHQGQLMPFTFEPNGATGPSIAGNVIVDGWNMEEINSGSNSVSKFAWPIQGQITITPPP